MSIREDLAPGSTVIRLEATDDDDGANAVLTYTIMSQSGGENFELNPTTGDVTTLRSFNRETFAGPYTVIVSALLKMACYYSTAMCHYWDMSVK